MAVLVPGATLAAQDYALGPDFQRQAGAPRFNRSSEYDGLGSRPRAF